MCNAMLLVVVSVVVAMVTAKPASQGDSGLVRSYSFTTDTQGSYQFGYDTIDGTERHESGSTQIGATGEMTAVVRGTVRWMSPDGVRQGYQYVSDEDGYRTKPIGPEDNGHPGFPVSSVSNTGCVRGSVLVNGECVKVYAGDDTIDDEGEDGPSVRRH